MSDNSDAKLLKISENTDAKMSKLSDDISALDRKIMKLDKGVEQMISDVQNLGSMIFTYWSSMQCSHREFNVRQIYYF